MTAPKMMGGATGKTRFVLAAHLIFLVCSMLAGGIVHAQPATQPATETGTEPAVIEDAPIDVGAELEAILKANSKCLRCHSREKFKTLENGQELSLQVHTQEFTDSAHGEIGCIGCHEAIGNRKHPSKSTNITISNQREYAVELNQSCRNCHDKKYTQYEGGIHASLVEQGSEKAPLCSDCHSAHAVEPMNVYQPETGFPCKNCHQNIFNAYVESVHGTARTSGNIIRDEHIQAPICADCHQSHDITAVAIGDTLRSQCMGCHENVPLLHSQWLPNAGTHLDIVSCAVCHAPFAKHRVDLHLYDNAAQVPLAQHESYDLIQQHLLEIEETEGDVDPLAVWKLIEESGQSEMSPDISLRGRMEVKSGVWAHQIASKAFAVRTCDSCHQKGARKDLNVTVSIPQQDGRVQRFETDREELGAVDSISKFFELGGNRNRILDILILLSLISGFAIPIGHFTLGRMIREKMERGE